MAKKEVTVYSKPSCVQCDATKRWLRENGYPEGEFLEEDAVEKVDALKSILNASQAPVVKVMDPNTGETTTWTGFSRDLLIKHLNTGETTTVAGSSRNRPIENVAV